jgi:hypothetical protein
LITNVLRRTFEPHREEVTGELRKLHHDEFYNIHSSHNIIKLIKSRRMRWMDLVARMEEMRNSYIFVGKSPERREIEKTEALIKGQC